MFTLFTFMLTATKITWLSYCKLCRQFKHRRFEHWNYMRFRTIICTTMLMPEPIIIVVVHRNSISNNSKKGIQNNETIETPLQENLKILPLGPIFS